MQKLSVIIPAAGMSPQIKPYIPRPLIKVNQTQTVVSRQVKLINKHHPNAEIIIVLGHDFDTIVSKLPASVRVVQNERYEQTGILRSIGIGMRAANPTNNVLIVTGDLVFNEATIKEINPLYSTLIVDTKKQIHNNEVGVTTTDGYATQLSYGLPTKWAQIAYLTGNELSLLKRIAWSGRHDKWNAFEAINHAIDMGACFRVFEPKNMAIVEIDASSDIQAARSISR